MFKFKFFEKNIPYFGLDLSGSSMKLLELSSRGRGLVVKGYSDIELPKGITQDDSLVDTNQLSQLIKDSVAKPAFGKIDTKHVIASLPESKSFVRVIHIPEMSEAEIDNAILFEAESYIPIPIDQVYLDWQQLSKTGNRLEILIVASPREHVDKYLQVLENAGLIPIALEVESQSVVRTLIKAGSTETTLVVDIDAFNSNMIMVENGTLHFTSSIPIAGHTFTEAIAKGLGVTPAKADEIKKKVGIDNTTEYPNLKTTLLPILNNLAAEIKNILSFHAEHSENKVTKLLLCGGGARLNNLKDFLTPEFASMPELKVELAEPWNNFSNVDSTLMDPADALRFTTAIGLASRNLIS